MPVDDEARRELESIRQSLVSVADRLDQVSTPALSGPSADRRIDLLWKVYNEISNYDRHYSTVRSALTVLLVSVGLAAASEPLKGLFAVRATAAAAAAVQPTVMVGLVHVVLPFVPMLLIFGLSVPVNAYFQRLTASCRILEREVERRILELSPGLGQAGQQNPMAAGTTLYEFRQDLTLVYGRTTFSYLDEMKKLLISGIVIFTIFVTLTAFACYRWPLPPIPVDPQVKGSSPTSCAPASAKTP